MFKIYPQGLCEFSKRKLEILPKKDREAVSFELRPVWGRWRWGEVKRTGKRVKYFRQRSLVERNMLFWVQSVKRPVLTLSFFSALYLEVLSA